VEVHSVDTKRHASKSGQALTEFCVCLIAILTVIGGIFQLGRLGLARTEARVEATNSATYRSMLASDVTGLSIPRYIDRMSDGTDDRTYSEDDYSIGGNEQRAYDELIGTSRPELLRAYAPDNDFAEMGDSFEMMIGMGLVRGTGSEYGIAVLPIVRRLIMNNNSVDIRVDAWMVRTGEIY